MCNEKTRLKNGMRCIIATVIAIIACTRPLAAQEVSQGEDGSVAIKSPIYNASFDKNGNLTELAVKGAKAFTHKFVDANPKSTAFSNVSIRVMGNQVFVRSGDARTEWTFGEDQIGVLTEGYGFECQLDNSVKLIIIAGGKSMPYDGRSARTASGGVIGLVLENMLTAMSVSNGQPYSMHVHSPRIFPNGYLAKIKPGTLLEWTWKFGGSPSSADLLTGIQLKGIGADESVLQKTGNKGQGLVHFPAGVPVALEISQINKSEKEPITIEYRVELWDHYICSSPYFKGFPADPEEITKHLLFTKVYPSTLNPGETNSVTIVEKNLPPGFYYLNVSAWRNGEKLAEVLNKTITVDLLGYKAKTSRPPDFEDFWKRQDEKLIATPLNPVVTKVSSATATGEMWKIVGDMPGGKKFWALYEIPAAPSSDYVMMSGTIDKVKLETAASAPDWISKAPMRTLYGEAVDAATYNRWTSAEDNNMLDNILVVLRGIDYLKSRPDIKPRSIRLFGASRGGPLVVIPAARRPSDIAGAAAHVHTSCGIGWTDKPYSGWGVPSSSSYNPRNPASVARFVAMAAYFDPVNHAQDVRCPMTFAYGDSDGLSPAEGIEAAYILCGSAWKRISRDAGGHVFSGGCQANMKELDDLLKSAPGIVDQERIMKDH